MVAPTGETEKNTLTTEYDYEKNPLATPRVYFFVRDYLCKIIAPDESPRQLPKYDKGENDERCLALRSRNRFTVISIIEF